MKEFKKGDRFKYNSYSGIQTGTINAVSFNSIQQEWEYYVTYDGPLSYMGVVCHTVDSVGNLWEEIDKIADANDQSPPDLPIGLKGFLDQQGIPEMVNTDAGDVTWQYKTIHLGPDYSKSGCDHKWVDVGFSFTKVVCKHCNMEQK